jgi:hypothetical protein
VTRLALAHNLQKFPHFVLFTLLEDGFLDSCAYYYHSFRDISDAVSGLGCIVNWIGVAEPEIQAIWTSRFVELQLPEIVEAFNEHDGRSDDRQISRLREDGQDIEEELLISRLIDFHV